MFAACAVGAVVAAAGCRDSTAPVRAVDGGVAEDAFDATLDPRNAREGAVRREPPMGGPAAGPAASARPSHLTCCGPFVCLRFGFGVKRLAECAYGCEGGACLPCAPRCDRRCGDDGCGGTCALCAAGETCVAGTCACVPEHHTGCCPEEDIRASARVCRFDSCGGAPVPIADCPAGCLLGACVGCVADCEGRACGDDGCGASCGACGQGAACVEGLCVCGPGAQGICCGDALCDVDACGALGPPSATCPWGCFAAACLGCVPACEGRACGPDGCGGSCGACPIEGQTCGGDGQCACEAGVGLACCAAGGGVCAVDACGGVGAVIASCAHGCVGGACLPCQPACDGKDCGDDGCGGACGAGPCAGGAVCVDGSCTCVPTEAVGCCGDGVVARCRLDSCGAPTDVLGACPFGCVGGVCVPCVYSCTGKDCGPDGCGGSCGACPTGSICEDGACSCVPACDGRDCGPDGCGGACGACPTGSICEDGACSCVPACDGKTCGPDGCGGSCGACPTGSFCTSAGLCAAASATLTGRFLRERRVPNAALTGLMPLDVAAAARVPVLIAEGGVLRASVETDEDGRVSVPLTPAPTGPITATLVATRVGATGQPLFSVIDSAGVPFPTSSGYIHVTRVWAWAVNVPTDLAFGDVTIAAAQGSGALQLYGWLRDLHAGTLSIFEGAGPVMPSLAVLWAPGLAPPCGACFLPAGWGPVRLTTPDAPPVNYGRAIWLSGTTSTPYHWTPSVVGHEYGHYVMDVFSRSPNVGGAHSWDSLVAAPLAFSEGFATFFGQWWLELPRFFAVQSGTQYWIDIERIGTPPTTDDSSLSSLIFPLPRYDLPLTQDLNEGAVAAILWDIWDEVSLIVEPETADLGDLIFDILSSERMLDPALDRGYCTATVSPPNVPAGYLGCKADLVDLLDAIRCAEALTESVLRGAIMGLPYDGALKTCPE